MLLISVFCVFSVCVASICFLQFRSYNCAGFIFIHVSFQCSCKAAIFSVNSIQNGVGVWPMWTRAESRSSWMCQVTEPPKPRWLQSFLLLTEFVEFFILKLKVVRPEPLADAGALRPQSSPAIFAVSVSRVGADRQVLLVLQVLVVHSAAAARHRDGDVAEPVGREEPDAARQERQEHGERRQDKHKVLSHYPNTHRLR